MDSATLVLTGGTGIDTSATGSTVTYAIDSTVVTLAGSQTLTNKSITSPTITGTITAGALYLQEQVHLSLRVLRLTLMKQLLQLPIQLRIEL